MSGAARGVLSAVQAAAAVAVYRWVSAAGHEYQPLSLCCADRRLATQK